MKTFHRISFYLGAASMIICGYFYQTDPETFNSQSNFNFSILDNALFIFGLFIFFYAYALIRCLSNLAVRRHKPILAWLFLVLFPLLGPYLYFELVIFPSSQKRENSKDDPLPDIMVSNQVTFRRALASAFDYGIFLSVAFAYVRLFGHETVPGTYELSGAEHLILLLAAWFIWFPIPESIWGQTIGKAIFRVKVFANRGAKANFGLTLRRHLLDIPDIMIGAALVAVTSRKGPPRRLGDMWAGTIVASKNEDFLAIGSRTLHANASGAT